MIKDERVKEEIDKIIKENGLSKFLSYVERTVAKGESTYLAAVIDYCNEHDIEPEDLKWVIDAGFKERLRVEAMHLNLLTEKPTSNTLL